jgi:precorrin-3B C17-methyltransferase
MAGLLMELVGEYPGVTVEVVPGVSAANGGAGLLGAPLMNDWCCISLSDLMTPWEEIEGRLRAAARTGFCVCLYNPGSQGRGDCLARACDVLLEHLGEDTVCGIARNVGRSGETSEVLTLGELRGAEVDMRTCVFVGNAQTKVVAGRMVTPRGYDKRRERPAGLRRRQPRGM